MYGQLSLFDIIIINPYVIDYDINIYKKGNGIKKYQ